jgi:hypothetical protein
MCVGLFIECFGCGWDCVCAHQSVDVISTNTHTAAAIGTQVFVRFCVWRNGSICVCTSSLYTAQQHDCSSTLHVLYCTSCVRGISRCRAHLRVAVCCCRVCGRHGPKVVPLRTASKDTRVEREGGRQGKQARSCLLAFHPVGLKRAARACCTRGCPQG